MTLLIVDEITEKVCPKCAVSKPLTGYHKDKRSPDGRTYWCKDCACQNARDNHRKRYTERPDYRLSKKSDYLKNRYGLSLEEYLAKLASQRFCAICKHDLITDPKPAHLDHCHSSGKLRGFLCRHCNWGLGDFKDDVTLLNNAIDYLKEYK